MQISHTYLKNNGLYQKKLNNLIFEGDSSIAHALELYNLFHGSAIQDRTFLENSPVFQHHSSYLRRTGVLRYLKHHTAVEYEGMLDFLIQYSSLC